MSDSNSLEAPVAARVLLDPGRRWRTEGSGVGLVHYAGFAPSALAAGRILLDALDRAGDLSEALGASVPPLPGHFAVLVETPRFVAGLTDECLTRRLYYAGGGGRFALANCARLLCRDQGLDQPDTQSLECFSMAGFVSGADTCIRGLRQMQAAELVVADRVGGGFASRRIRPFYPARIRTESRAQLMAELAEASDAMFRRVVAQADGRPVWIPLSGGWDSRLVLAKLVQLGCPGLQAFSYGPPGNDESRVAQAVAARLGVPWKFVPTTREAFRSYFNSDDRRDYWRFADGLGVLPFTQDHHVLLDMLRGKALPSDAVIVNGQSGDFITGGHIPEGLRSGQTGRDAVVEAVVRKHFGLWRGEAAQALLAGLRERVGQELDSLAAELGGVQSDYALYECWEWQERQSKYVVGGQQAYDHLGLDWAMPLWDREYLDFWPGVPLADKIGQKLYKDWLLSWDFRGVFSTIRTRVWRWPGIAMVALPLAQLAGLVRGRRGKDAVYRTLRYFGHTGQYFAAYGLRDFLGRTQQARNANSFFASTWLEENFGQNTISTTGLPKGGKESSCFSM